jgi:hypothetical protein
VVKHFHDPVAEGLVDVADLDDRQAFLDVLLMHRGVVVVVEEHLHDLLVEDFVGEADLGE